MDKSFWQAIQANDYAVPIGYSVDKLTPELLSLFGEVDPELRDEIAFPIFEHWLEREHYTAGEMRILVGELSRNLRLGLGEIGGDAVFLRSFSALGLAALVNYDNRQPFLEADEVRQLAGEAAAYLKAELDLRGYVPGKGWAHAIAHTADLLAVLAKNCHLEAADFETMLNAIADRVTHSGMLVFLYDEDERLATAARTILLRGALPPSALLAWLRRFTHPLGRAPWAQSFLSEYDRRAFVNTRNFLRSLYFQLIRLEHLPPPMTDFIVSLRQTLDELARGY